MVQILELISQKDASCQELEHISDCVVNSQRIVVVAGAGISCSGGIPVFFPTTGNCCDEADNFVS
jgi:hypothetical protein